MSLGAEADAIYKSRFIRLLKHYTYIKFLFPRFFLKYVANAF